MITMATLEQILDEARKLPIDEQRRLRDALEELTSNGDKRSSFRTRVVEHAWIDAHREEFLDQWVALDEGDLVAHGTDARAVYDEARARGITVPYLVHVTPKVEAYVGGW
jgi:hypothetical protein